MTAHDHASCLTAALACAQALCAERSLRLTPLRQQVLESLWQSHQARGAYDILAGLKSKSGRPLAPLSVYRALDFLVDQGFAHRIESLNAYIGCPHAGETHALQFLVCSNCHTVTELEDRKINLLLNASAKASGFTPTRSIVEVIGLCRDCHS